MFRSLALFSTLVLLSLTSWGCDSGDEGPTGSVTVMSQNLYLGGDIFEVTTATEASQVPGIVGRVYGEVDFVVIKVRVEVVARATIAFAVERFQPILVALTAEVSVEASVEVLFITVDFSFELTIEQRFTIDSPEPGPAPWLQA